MALCYVGRRTLIRFSVRPASASSLAAPVAPKTVISIRRLNTGQTCSQAGSDGRSFFSKLLNLNVGGSFAPLTAAHSKVLTTESTIYELQLHYVKPKLMEDYKISISEIYSKLHHDAEHPGDLVGSWTTQFGEVDQAVHLWKYTGGYKAISEAKKRIDSFEDLRNLASNSIPMLRRREHQLLQSFHFWGEPQERQPEHIYELRSYSLKPGTMIEWGNNWGRAIKIRQKDAVGGFFSQIGELYQVHHIWAYTDLHHRKEAREIMWQEPGWDDCVANTLPLVNKMESRLLVPLPISPLQ